MQVTAAVVETAAVALACVHALKFKKKKGKARAVFPLFRLEQISAALPVLG